MLQKIHFMCSRYKRRLKQQWDWRFSCRYSRGNPKESFSLRYDALPWKRSIKQLKTLFILIHITGAKRLNVSCIEIVIKKHLNGWHESAWKVSSGLLHFICRLLVECSPSSMPLSRLFRCLTLSTSSSSPEKVFALVDVKLCYSMQKFFLDRRMNLSDGKQRRNSRAVVAHSSTRLSRQDLPASMYAPLDTTKTVISRGTDI